MPLPPALLRRLAGVVIAAAVVLGSGSHWILLQSVAWVGMVAAYAQDRPLAEAVADTLDGQHPCALCNAIAEAKKGEAEAPDGKAPPAPKAAKKLWAAAEDASIRCLRPRAEMILITVTDTKGTAWWEAPPLPPPRLG